MDELYGTALATGVEAGVAVLAGPSGPSGELTPSVPADVYRRLARDLGDNGIAVVADLSGPALAALEGGIEFLKLSRRELVEGGFAEGDAPAQLVGGMHRLHEAGARNVLLSRARAPALAYVGERLLEIVPPRFEPIEPRGPGDAMTAAVAVGLARGLGVEPLLRCAAAAGALNVTRRGLGTGRCEDIERVAARVEVREIPGGRPG